MFSVATFLDPRANSLQCKQLYYEKHGEEDMEEDESEPKRKDEDESEEEEDADGKAENEEDEKEKVGWYTKQLQDMETFMDGYDEEKLDLEEVLRPRSRDREMKDIRAVQTCDSDEEDLAYRPNDCLCITLTTNAEDEVSELQLNVYEPEKGNLYVHHHFLLPAFPLALAWFDIEPDSRSLKKAKKGNFVAIGTFDCSIGIYNVDMLNSLEEWSLGGRKQPDKEEISYLRGNFERETDETKRQELVKAIEEAEKGKLQLDSHSDSVTCLDWNEKKRTVLASGSADKTVKLWDILTQICTQTLEIHTDKVQDLMWHPVEENILLTGGYDKVAKMTDIRKSGAGIQFQLDTDVECIKWNYHNPASLLCTTESGKLFCFDARRPESPLLEELVTYQGPAAALDINKHKEGFIATGGLDKETRLWKLDLSTPSLKLITEKNLQCGGVFCTNFSPRENYPYLLLTGGEENYAIWNTDEIDRIVEMFPRSGKFTYRTEL